jgi:DNA-binding response OmpR family regulator
MKILLIDDNILDRESLAAQLERRGHSVTQAIGGWVGQQAIKLIKPDLIISEVSMPGITGINVLSDLRQAGKLTPFVFLTRLDTADDKKVGLALGANAYLIKPVPMHCLEFLLGGVVACA